MAEVNGAHRHGRYEKIWLKSLHVMLNVKSVYHTDTWPARQTTHYIDPYDAHMMKKGKKSVFCNICYADFRTI